MNLREIEPRGQEAGGTKKPMNAIRNKGLKRKKENG